MQTRRYLSPLTALALVGSALVTAGPSVANGSDCSSATAMGQGTSVGTGTVGALGPSEWWKHTALPAPRTISVSPLSNTAVLQVNVIRANCSVVPMLCSRLASDPPCTTTERGEIRIEVRWIAGQGDYMLTVTVPPPTECSDGTDNDSDTTVDYPADQNCTSYEDVTEAPVRRAVGGHITLVGRYFGPSNNSLRWVLTGDFDPIANKYSCTGTISPAEVTCTRHFDPEWQLHCTSFVLTARAPGQDQTNASGFIAGRVTCDSGNPLQTDDVNGAGTEVAYNGSSNNPTGAPIDLGTADRVVCRALGVNGAPQPLGSFEVDCYEPGVQWPFADKPPLANG